MAKPSFSLVFCEDNTIIQQQNAFVFLFYFLTQITTQSDDPFNAKPKENRRERTVRTVIAGLRGSFKTVNDLGGKSNTVWLMLTCWDVNNSLLYRYSAYSPPS